MCTRGPLRILPLAASQRDSSAAGKAEQFTCISFVQFSSIIGIVRTLIPVVYPPRLVRVAVTRQGKTRVLVRCLWECPRESSKSPRGEERRV